MICRVTSHILSSRPPQPQQSSSTGLLLRSRYIIFKYWKWWFDCSCQVSGHFHPCDQIQQTLLCSQLIWLYPLSWTKSTDTSLFSAYLVASSFLEHSPLSASGTSFSLLTFRITSFSLLTFHISVDLSFFSTVVSVSSLFHMWLLLKAQFYSPSLLASLPSFLFWICSPQVVSSFPMFNFMDMLISTKFIIKAHTSQRSMLTYPTSYVVFLTLSIPETSQF